MPTTAYTTANVSTGKPGVSGAIYRAPLSTTLPTDASTALASAFTCLGYINEDGVTNNSTPESDVIRAWGGDIVLAFQTGKIDEFSFTLMEVLNADVLKAVHGDSNVTTATGGAISVTVNDDEQTENVWVIDMILRGNRAKRIVIPDGKITEIGEVVYKDDEAVGYEITLTAMSDSSGNTHYEYIAAPASSTT